MIPEELAILIRATLLDVTTTGRISIDPLLVPDSVTMERPRVREYGDWATNVAIQLGKETDMVPREFAQILADDLAATDDIDSVEVVGPGFINIRLGAGAAGELARTIVEAGAAYGHDETPPDRSINLKYASTSPTGPVYLDGVRWAAVGDSLIRLMVTSGAAVTREYCSDDHGLWTNHFSYSLCARTMGHEVPEDGYGGQYIADIVDQVRTDACATGGPNPITLPEKEAIEVSRARGAELMSAETKERLRPFRTDSDAFFREESLHTSGAIAAAIEYLRERDEIFDEDGVVWLYTITYDDDKDRVLIKSDGQATYFTGDAAYYLDKREHDVDVVIYLLGVDHHDYIVRMMVVYAVFGDRPGGNLQILIGQLVNLVKDGKPVRMSECAGTTATLDDLVDAVGADTVCYAPVRASTDTRVDIDLDPSSQYSNDNPIYYAQCAHVCVCSVTRNAAEHGVTRDAGLGSAALDFKADEVLLAALAQLPAQVA